MRQFLVPCPGETRAPLGEWSIASRFLERRGTPLELLPGESPDELENRIGTRLMALFRDSRDPDCFDALYAFSGAAVLSWIRSLLGRELGHLDPHEILQDTFVNVYRYPGSFRADHPGSFRVWVRTIAGNVVRRSSNVRSRSPFQELAEEERELVDSGQGPVDAVSNGEQERRLKLAWILFLCHYARAWKDLSQRDRRTLHLVEVEGLSYEQAGEALSVGRSNMKMIVFRSRKRIARRMRAAMSGTRGACQPELVA